MEISSKNFFVFGNKLSDSLGEERERISGRNENIIKKLFLDFGNKFSDLLAE